MGYTENGKVVIVAVGVLYYVLTSSVSTGSPQPFKRRGSRSTPLLSTTTTNGINPLAAEGGGEKFGNETYFNDIGEICNAEAVLQGGGLPASSGGGGSTNLAHRCRKLDIGDIKKHSLLMIKQEILRKLRLDESRLPNISAAGHPIPAAYLSEFFQGQYQGDSPNTEFDDDEHAKTEKIIAFAKIGQKKINNHAIHHFSFSDKLGNMKIEGATLHVHVKFLTPNADKKSYSIRLMEIVPTLAKGDSPVSIQVGLFKPNSHTTSTVTSGGRHRPQTKWIQVEVKQALVNWMAEKKFGSSKKIALIIEAVEANGLPSKDVAIETATNDINNYPFIEVQVSENGKSRPPRNLGMTCDENSQEDRCCRYPLTVDFEDFGWDWIIAPKKYDANYCSGKCPYAFLQRYPHNHIVQQANPSGVGGPCCAARKMSSISMLYFDSDSNIVFSVLPGMVVDKCGCS
ncbi:growth/differentiation factor 8 isoform X2 [Folsomia candida]|uniref:growth/differentiation factor 8 isoform X2 n=1 Tax=Folsomia candida TaxID=158441 RepID=UPI000B8F8FCD|nr:growth/differentiation factor 8 isoform X2 [Folsomia candida]